VLQNGRLDIVGGEQRASSFHVPTGTVVTVSLTGDLWNDPSVSDQSVLAPQSVVRYCDGSTSWPYQVTKTGQAHIAAAEHAKEAGAVLDVTILSP